MSYTEWQIFDSSSIAAGRYDADSSVLEIQFNEGKIYKYVDVPRDTWLSLCRADSKGGYFQSQIRDRFRHELKGGSSSSSEYKQPSATRQPEVKPGPPPLPSHASAKGVITGGTLNNPFHTSSIPYAYKLLDSLSYKTPSGKFKILAERLGSKKVDGLPEPVDCYELYIRKNDSSLPKEKIMDFFVYSYSGNPHTIENLPEELIFNGIQSQITSMNPEKDAGKSYYDLAIKTMEEGKGPEDAAKSIVLLRKAAELNYQPAQELLFVVLTKRGDGSKATITEARKWFYRSERSKQGLPNSPATDFTTGREGGGCASVIVISALTVASLYFI